MIIVYGKSCERYPHVSSAISVLTGQIKILILLNLYYINYVGIKKYSKKLRGY
ncbi:hypothetical protein M115_4520 [Bacteroides fragilis str. 3719 T6]|nr:hypothetical protein M115_4520 [Bacteroides fragilis str. 3719 T6]